MACQNLFRGNPGESVTVSVRRTGLCTIQGEQEIVDCANDPVGHVSLMQQRLEQGFTWELEANRRYILRILRTPDSCSLEVTHVFQGGDQRSDECPGGSPSAGPYVVSTCTGGGE